MIDKGNREIRHRIYSSPVAGKQGAEFTVTVETLDVNHATVQNRSGRLGDQLEDAEQSAAESD